VRARRLIVAAVAALAVVAVVPSPASAGVHDCSKDIQVHNRLGAIATVLNVRDMRCRTARRVIRRHGRDAGNAAFGPAGSKFALGPWACTVYFRREEAHRARCVHDRRAFRLYYGS
jgi:hypothetical protein